MTHTIENRPVADDEGVLRLDRWFRQHYPQLSQIQLQKLLRTGQVRVDGKRAKASDRVYGGQIIRIPPLPDAPILEGREKKPTPIPERLIKELKERVLFKDDAVLVIDKPAGLAVQGGSGTKIHLDGALEYLRFDSPHKPRLVHRLDKDTSGVMILARTPEAARQLAESFRRHLARKYYWAVTVGRPPQQEGMIDASIAKSKGNFEKMIHDDDNGQEALTYYHIVQSAGKIASWVTLWPVTGRTHQLRVHLAHVGCPIVGDGKYGDKSKGERSSQLHLFARRLIIPHPSNKKKMIDVCAPLPEHFKQTFSHFGFEGLNDDNPFENIKP